MKDQRSLEGEMKKLGIQRYRRRVRKAKENQLESTTSSGRRLLKDASAHLLTAINNWCRVARRAPGPRHAALDYFKLLPRSVTAALATRCVLDCISYRKLYTRTTMKIGGRVEDEVRFRALKKSDPARWRGVRASIDDLQGYQAKRRWVVAYMREMDHAFQNWPRGDKLQLGTVLLELLIKATGIVEIREVRNIFNKTQLEVHITDETLRWIEKSDATAELLTPMYLPCVEPPKDWVTPLRGGFHSTNLYSAAVVKTPDRRHIEDLAGSDMDLVYRAINSLQSTPWRINSKVFEVFYYLWSNGYEGPGLPPREDVPIPNKPEDIGTCKQARKEWKRSARMAHDINQQRKAERLTVAKIINVATKFQNQPVWFTHQMDWRGRAYPMAYHLHPQGPDYVKALLEFHEGKPVPGGDPLMWHMIHGANCWGMDKASFSERIQWVHANKPWIGRIQQDPLSNRQWEGAEDPWQFLAWCLDDGDVSHLPIHQDATQSGIQIMSLLLRDEVGAAATNCLPCDTPQDLYQSVTDEVVKLLKNDSYPLSQPWLDFGITRDCCKRPVMTRVYNATIHSCAKYVREWAQGFDNKQIPKTEDIGSYNSTWYLAKTVWKAMEGVIQGTTKCQDWLGQVAAIFVEHDIPIRWTTPLGFLVKQKYTKWSRRAIKTAIGDVIRQTCIRSPLDNMDKRKMVNAFAPNLVHSLDAAAMMATINLTAATGVRSFAAVHDSFATHAMDSATLASAIREAYVQVFRDDFLGDLKAQLEMQLPDGVCLPDLPPYGDLQLEALRDSLYFFN